MFKVLDEYNTQGKIQTFLTTYKDLEMRWGGLNEFIEWYKGYIKEVDKESSIIAFDIETSKLYPIDNKFLMFAFAYKHDNIYKSVAFDCRDWSREEVIKVLKLINKFKSKIVLHNAYFDITTLAIMYGVKVKWDYDTYIIYHNAMTHRAKDEEDNDFGQDSMGLSLKDLTRDLLPYGDYEEQLKDFKKNYCKENGLKAKEFTYDLIPKETLAPYNCMDVICTLQIFEKSLNLIKALEKSGYLKLREIIKMKHEVSDIYIDARLRGIYVDRTKIKELNSYFTELMVKSKDDIYTHLSEHIQYVEKEIYFKSLEKELMKDFEYIAENKPKVSAKTGKETWVAKKVNITESRSEKLQEECKINFNSSQHKAMLFVDSMGLKPLEVSRKTNAPKCDIKFMEHHLRLNPELQSFMDYGKCRTAINNFLGVNKVEEDDEGESELGKGDAKTLWELTSDDYPYIHSSYNLNGTVTSRCSCNTINLQQIPSKSILKSIKKCFSARKEHYVLYSDYSSAEVTIMGSVIKSKIIHDSLVNKWDLHSMNAWLMLKEDILKVHPEWEERFLNCGDDVVKLREFYSDIKSEFEHTVRFKTKSLVFSLAYGTTEYGVSKNLGISKKEAKELIDSYLKANSEMDTYIKYQHNKAKKYGYTENSFGSRLMLPDAPNMYSTSDRNVRMRGDKQLKKSLNYAIQSANAQILYEGLIRAKKLIKEQGLEGKINFIFSVYDSFCYEIHNSVPKEVALDIIERAFVCYLGDFYLGIDSEIGDSWGTVGEVKRERRNKNEVHNYNMSLY